MKKRNVVILGSTGSIGINALDVISRFPEKFNVVGLSAYNNCALLKKQVQAFSPSYVAASSKNIADLKKDVDTTRTTIVDAQGGMSLMASLPEVDIVLIGITGSAALDPFLAAIKHGKIIAPANKEALVIAGEIIMAEARRHNAQIVPIDSEQSAIFQCLDGRAHGDVKKVHLTASGGVLRRIPRKRFDSLSKDDLLKHPRWKMGQKITIDSATLMNKGFEVIEARWLFDIPVDSISVVVHPEAIIHSMVEFIDGSILAQLGITDMRLPIQYAMTYPERVDSGLQELDFYSLKKLRFFKPDVKKFPSLDLAYYAARCGATCPAVLNAADEVAVAAFLKGKISFTKIYTIVEKTVLAHTAHKKATLADIKAADIWARGKAESLL